MSKIIHITKGQPVEEIHQRLLSYIDSSDQYTLQNNGENAFGEKRINVKKDALRFKIVISEGTGHEYPEGTIVRIFAPYDTFEPETVVDATKAYDALIKTAKETYAEIETAVKASYGIEEHQPMHHPVSADDLPPSDRKFLTWLDIFPPEEVETIGEQRLLTAPADVSEQLPDGSIILVSKHMPDHPEPLDDIADHVGIRSWQDYPEERVSETNFER
ncbi:hypothetical protein [Halomicrobium katesii]|uniref:hypothetical protein n=1 Tax=Halomicrobium katesii TaxID=437163 RepID=UPI00037D8B69|nr:hypothetical protein [Halomicrobium katesii]